MTTSRKFAKSLMRAVSPFRLTFLRHAGVGGTMTLKLEVPLNYTKAQQIRDDGESSSATKVTGGSQD